MVNLEATERLFALYWNLHKQGLLPLLAMVLVSSELATPDWSELVEAHIMEAIG